MTQPDGQTAAWLRRVADELIRDGNKVIAYQWPQADVGDTFDSLPASRGQTAVRIHATAGRLND